MFVQCIECGGDGRTECPDCYNKPCFERRGIYVPCFGPCACHEWDTPSWKDCESCEGEGERPTPAHRAG